MKFLFLLSFTILFSSCSNENLTRVNISNVLKIGQNYILILFPLFALQITSGLKRSVTQHFLILIINTDYINKGMETMASRL